MRPEMITAQKSQEVSALLAVPNSRISAGGTTFTPEDLKSARLVDISGLEGLDSIRQKGSRVEMGPLATLSAIAGSMLVKACAPALAESAALAATPDIRTHATIGGNIAAERVGDLALPLLASGAKLTIKTDADYREIPIARFWPVSGGNDLSYDEWITRITIPVPQDALWGAAFAKTGVWDIEQDCAAAAAVQIIFNEEMEITNIRGGIRIGSKTIRRMLTLEKQLKGKKLSEETILSAAQAQAALFKESADESELEALLKNILLRCLSIAEERRAV